MAKQRIVVIFGGTSSEHEISCISAAAIVENIPKKQYEVIKLGITKNGRWLLCPGSTEQMRDGSWNECPDNVPAIISPDRVTQGLVINHGGKLDFLKVDVAFPALHGVGGEDGSIQGLLQLAGIPFVGCGVLSSAMCMDKSIANLVFDVYGIPQTPWLYATRQEIANMETLIEKITAKLEFPVFAKPASGGSSVGVVKAKNKQELANAARLAAAHGPIVVFEQGVAGQEIECAVLGNQNIVVTRPGEILSCNEVYDYEAKYHSGDASQTLMEARINGEKLDEVKEIAGRAYKALRCEGLARVDFFVEEGTGRVLINEINTLPGFTPISMYPKLMERVGYSFPELTQQLIELALERSEI